MVDSVEQPIRIYQNSRAESSPKRQKYDLTSCFFENTLPLLQKCICMYTEETKVSSIEIAVCLHCELFVYNQPDEEVCR